MRNYQQPLLQAITNKGIINNSEKKMMKRSASDEDIEAKPSQRPRLEPRGEGDANLGKDDPNPKEDNNLEEESCPGKDEGSHSAAYVQAVKKGNTEDGVGKAESLSSSAKVATNKECEAVKTESAAEMKAKEKDPVESQKPPPSPSLTNKKEDPSETVSLSYPKPKNFAERMMNALERGIALESVWWVGGGKAIALHPKNLKASPDLTSYFRAKDYSGFIRNCNRWGFRRVAHYSVAPGIVTYENSLFQKDQPHLVKHMRMDSDVQDVFARHQLTGETGEAEPDKAARIIAEAKALKGPSRVNRKAKSSSGGPAEGAATREDQQPNIAAAVAALTAATSASNPSNQPHSESTISKEFMLRKILQLTDQFLDHPGTLYSDDDSFRTTMQLVRALGQQHQKDLLTKGHLNTLLRLEGALQSSTASPGLSLPMLTGSSLSAQGLSRGLNPLQQLLGRASSQPTAPNGSDDPLEALLLRSRFAAQDQQQRIQQQQQQQQQGRHAASNLVQRLLVVQGQQASPQQQGMNPDLRAPPHLARMPPSQQEEMKYAQDGGDGSEESPQFTTAQELLLRVMKQNKGPPGS